jgi:hypothetical protein
MTNLSRWVLCAEDRIQNSSSRRFINDNEEKVFCKENLWMIEDLHKMARQCWVPVSSILG